MPRYSLSGLKRAHSYRYFGHITANPNSVAGPATVYWDTLNKKYVKVLPCPPGLVDAQGNFLKDAKIKASDVGIKAPRGSDDGLISGEELNAILSKRKQRSPKIITGTIGFGYVAFRLLKLVFLWVNRGHPTHAGEEMPPTFAIVAACIMGSLIGLYFAWSISKDAAARRNCYLVDATPRDVYMANRSLWLYLEGESFIWWTLPIASFGVIPVTLLSGLGYGPDSLLIWLVAVPFGIYVLYFLWSLVRAFFIFGRIPPNKGNHYISWKKVVK